jgi:CRP-like cAMP-binding protein
MNLSDLSVSDYISDMWAPLTEEQRAFLSKNFSLQLIKKNERIYCEGEKSTHLMCVLTGKVKIFKDGVGRNQVIRIIKAVDYFGYRAYFAGEDYVTEAAAVEPSILCFIPMPVIMSLIRENNDLARVFIRRLALDVGVSDKRSISVTQKQVRGRLAEALLFLKETYGLEEDGSTLSIYLTREDLAGLSNMTTPNAIRTLSLYSNERIISIDGRKIKIIDEDRLKKISKLG